MIPVLFLTYNRLEYTKKALEALVKCKSASIFIIDNASTDGTREWLQTREWLRYYAFSPPYMKLNKENLGIAGAMNQFLYDTTNFDFIGKVDNDTVVPEDFIVRMLPHMIKADIVQAKHPLIKATHTAGFDDWVSSMPADGALRFNHFVGGSGILFRRSIVDKVPETNWMLGGWRQFQRERPDLRKAFATDVSIQLLDTNDDGADYSQYPDYYKETKRL